jgi:hypothetical protein
LNEHDESETLDFSSDIASVGSTKCPGTAGSSPTGRAGKDFTEGNEEHEAKRRSHGSDLLFVPFVFFCAFLQEIAIRRPPSPLASALDGSRCRGAGAGGPAG